MKRRKFAILLATVVLALSCVGCTTNGTDMNGNTTSPTSPVTPDLVPDTTMPGDGDTMTDDKDVMPDDVLPNGVVPNDNDNVGPDDVLPNNNDNVAPNTTTPGDNTGTTTTNLN